MDSMGEEYTSLVEQITSMQEALNARHTTPPSPAVLNQLGFAPEIARAMYSAGSPPAGIFGVGVAGFNGTRLGTRHPRSARSSPSMDNPSAPY